MLSLMQKYYNTISRLSKANVIILIALCVVSVLSIWAMGWNYSLLESVSSGFRVPESVGMKSDFYVSATGGVQLIISIIQLFVFLIWIYKFQKGLPLIGITDARWSPGWCVAWWFIPIMNLFRPYQVMAQFWRATNLHGSTASWKSATVPSLLMIWWITNVIAFWIANIALRFAMGNWGDKFSFKSALNELTAYIFSDAALVISSVLLIYVMKGITDQLRLKVRSLESESRKTEPSYDAPESKEEAPVKDFEIVAKQKPLKEKSSTETIISKPAPPKIDIITKKKT